MNLDGLDRIMPKIKHLVAEHSVCMDRARDFALPPDDMMAALVAAQAVLDQIGPLVRELGVEAELLNIEAKAHNIHRHDDDH